MHGDADTPTGPSSPVALAVNRFRAGAVRRDPPLSDFHRLFKNIGFPKVNPPEIQERPAVSEREHSPASSVRKNR
jgi:hypothetical protein